MMPSPAKPRPKALAQLVAFAFSPYEESLVHAYALKPPAHIPTASIPVIHDLVCVRLIQSGKYAEAIKLDRRLATGSGEAEGVVQRAAMERKAMMDELVGLMPAPERMVLEIELEGAGVDKGKNKGKGVGVGAGTGASAGGVEKEEDGDGVNGAVAEDVGITIHDDD